MLVIFILVAVLFHFLNITYFTQSLGEFLFTAIFADQSWTHKIYDNQNPDNYVYVSTENDDDEEDDTENICNKRLETCKIPNQTTSR